MPDLADTLQQEFEGHLENTHTICAQRLDQSACTPTNRPSCSYSTTGIASDDTETTNALAYLLENSCHHLHLIVASRTRTDFRSARYEFRVSSQKSTRRF